MKIIKLIVAWKKKGKSLETLHLDTFDLRFIFNLYVTCTTRAVRFWDFKVGFGFGSVSGKNRGFGFGFGFS